MDESPRFKLVFTRLREALEQEPHKGPRVKVEVRQTSEMSEEELEELESLRRIVLEVTDPEPMSFTTT